MLRLVAILAIAFKAWMLVDAVRRRAETHWLWIIVMVPGGAWAYLFMVKLRDRGMKQLGQRMLESLRRPPSVQELRYDFEQSPSLANKIRLAQGLFDDKQHTEAQSLFEQVLSEQPDNKDGLYGVGLCAIELGNLEAAVKPLARLVEQHRRYRDFAAWPPLAHAHFELGQTEEALALLEELVAAAPRLPHRLLHARYLVRLNRRDEARGELEKALTDYDHAPRHIRRGQWLAAREARAMLEELSPTR